MLVCPRCQTRLDAAAEATPTGRVQVDYCPVCRGIWLDAGELAAPMRAGSSDAFASSSPLLGAGDVSGPCPRHPACLRRRPPAVAALVLACVATFAWEMTGNPHARIEQLALVPSALLAGTAPWWTLITCTFLHASYAHLFGNLYFLWVFGDNVEDRLGTSRFLALYAMAGLAAGLLQATLTNHPTVPVVGASGAISGVLGSYLLLFPRTRLIAVLFFVRVRCRAAVYLGIWFGMQVVHAVMYTGSVAWWAHVGGFVSGLLLTTGFRQMAATPPRALVAPQPS
jgi:membrane associated rhomboid family serine protease